VIFKKLPKVNNHPMGEKSPNLVTLPNKEKFRMNGVFHSDENLTAADTSTKRGGWVGDFLAKKSPKKSRSQSYNYDWRRKDWYVIEKDFLLFRQFTASECFLKAFQNYLKIRLHMCYSPKK
jgi:hypothetical protein